MIGAISSYEGMAVGFFFIGLGEGGTTGSVFGTVNGAAGSSCLAAGNGSGSGSLKGSNDAAGASAAAGIVPRPIGPSTKGLAVRRLAGGAAMPRGSMESGRPIGRAS